MKAHTVAERRGPLAGDQLEAFRRGDQVRQPRNERGSVARVGREGTLPRLGSHDVARVGERERVGLVRLPRTQRAARVIEVEVGEDDDVDRLGGDAGGGERIEQDVVRFDDPEPLAQPLRKECPDAGLEQPGVDAVTHEQAPARERDPVALVGRDPLLPHRLRRVAEHRTSIEPLRIAEHRGERSHRVFLPRAVFRHRWGQQTEAQFSRTSRMLRACGSSLEFSCLVSSRAGDMAAVTTPAQRRSRSIHRRAC